MHFLYHENGQGSGAENFIGQRYIFDVTCVKVSTLDRYILGDMIHDPSWIYRYRKCNKMMSFIILGYFSLGSN